jgi:hypothetical protein
MDVDIEHRGLSYDLKEVNKAYKGCLIEGEFYEPMRPSEWLKTCQELESMVKYVAVPVILNGERISVDMKSQKWTMEDDDAYYLLDDSSRMQVYNLGVFVRNYHDSNLGQGGVIVSKKQLEVNFARNDILIAKCEVWKRIATVVRKSSRSKEEQKPRKTELFRGSQARDLISADVDSTRDFIKLLEEAEIFTDFRGRHWTLEGLRQAVPFRFSGQLVMAPSTSDRVCDKLHSTGQALALAPRTLERLHARSFPEMLDRLAKAISQTLGGEGLEDHKEFHLETIQALRGFLRDPQEIGKHIKTTHEIIETNKLSPEERRVLKLLNKTQHEVVRALSAAGYPVATRVLLAGRSDTALMWTDGIATIFINRNLLQVKGFHGSLTSHALSFANILVHEYLHNEQDTDSHVHSAEFFERYHNVLTYQGAIIGRFVNFFIEAYLKDRMDDKAQMRKGDLVALDQQAQLQKLAA